METKSAEYRQEVMTITPTLAGEILRLNSNNRNVRDYMVRQYAQMMKEGRWDENSPATISFYQDGTLADGQHRLLAVKRTTHLLIKQSTHPTPRACHAMYVTHLP